MAIETQSRIKRYSEKLRKNTFSHNVGNKYIFSCWNTKRDGTGVSYDDQKEVTFDSDITLYAIWRERQILTRYENLTISASDVNYDKEYVTLDYIISEVKYYEDSNVVLSTIKRSGRDNSNVFGKNGGPESGIQTSARKIDISYTAKNFPNIDKDGNITYLTATKTITQYGYSPLYCVDVEYDKNIIEVVGYQPNIHNPCSYPIEDQPHILSKTRITKTVISNNVVRFSCTTKDILLSVSSIKDTSYKFLNWVGYEADGISKQEVIVQGTLTNFKLISVKIGMTAILENVKFTNSIYQLDTAHKRSKSYYETYTIDQYMKLPYATTIKTGGMLNMSGLWGIKVFPCGCIRTGGFKVLLNGTVVKNFYNTLNDEDVNFDFNLKVNEGDKFTIDSLYSTTEVHFAILVKKLEVQPIENVTITSNNLYDCVKLIRRTDQMAINLENKIKNEGLFGEYADDTMTIVSKGDKTYNRKSQKPDCTEIFETTFDQKIVKIMINSPGIDNGYVYKLRITDITNIENDLIYQDITKGGRTTNYFYSTDTKYEKFCYIYMPSYSKIQIEGIWNGVNTIDNDIKLYIYSSRVGTN